MSCLKEVSFELWNVPIEPWKAPIELENAPIDPPVPSLASPQTIADNDANAISIVLRRVVREKFFLLRVTRVMSV